ncbi:MAG: hypothetical protein KGH79_04445 [Patescibacteria group bacterium]|nr:hypothetical protein [Patescibacteria group bacterium]
MTKSSQFYISSLFVAIALGALLFTLAQAAYRAISHGLAQSATIRIAEATSCQVSTGSTHFVGCSSILD